MNVKKTNTISQTVAAVVPSLQHRKDVTDWLHHWSADNQQTITQKFFSFYRKTVFARTVEFFVNHYFPASGIFIEAGSGTSETSMRINKHGRARKLVAVDIILPVLRNCHPIMDEKVGGDIFSLPFRANSVDGLWNVGVMEHFTHAEIDQIMREFHRVLKPGGRLILLWPGTNSIPQKILRIVEYGVNKWQQKQFHFHPAEISQLRSIQEGKQVLQRNSFKVLAADAGLRSLMAFKVLIGEKNAVTTELR